MMCDECWTEQATVIRLLLPELNEGEISVCTMCYGKYRQKLQEK
jgi:hypothetical protein